MKVKIGNLTKDGLQTRVALDERTVQEYADAMRDGDNFPPVKVFMDGSRCWLADGFHRVEAATRAGRTVIDADTAKGGFIDALRWALGCNAKHGKRVTNEDKQNAMQMAWDNRQQLFGGDPSTRAMAEMCGVARQTAATFIDGVANLATPQPPAVTAPVRRPMSANGGRQVAQNVLPQRPVRTVVGTDGKQYLVRPVRPAAAKAPTRPAAPAHVVPTDRFGVEIPVPLQAAFDGDGLAEVYAQISSARTRLRFGLENNVAEFAAVRQDALVQLDNAYSFVKSAQPYCVCRMCQGQGCKACHGRGWQTEDEYKRNPDDFKAK